MFGAVATLRRNPDQGKWLTPTDADAVEALHLADHVLSDEHVGAGPFYKLCFCIRAFSTCHLCTCGTVR